MKNMLPTCRGVLIMMLLGVFTHTQASIDCPADITIACHMSYTDTQMTGVATVYGSSTGPARYVDNTGALNRCDQGVVVRTWYVDKNYNYVFDPYEISCQQTITIQDIAQEVTVTFPDDRTYSCVEDIVQDYPSYQAGICDQIAVNVVDEEFNVVADACYKILRRYTVLNWCDYTPADPNWNGEGIWTGTQVIKVVDNQRPTLRDHGDITIGVGSDCIAGGIVLANQASDAGDCPSGELFHTLLLDLDHDGDFDTRYGYLEQGQYLVDPSGSGEEVTISLVEDLPIGSYKYKWSVHDGCGNFDDATGKLIVADQKPPTPYCLTVLHATVGGQDMPLTITPDIFDRGSFDNCSQQEQISISFTEDINDTVRVVDCNNAGIQFYRIYATDQFGNSEYCEAFLLAFDNGNCGFGFAANGSFSLPDGSMVPDISVDILHPDGTILGAGASDDEGQFLITDLELHADRLVVADASAHYLHQHVDIADLVVLRNHLLGLESIENRYGLMAADLSADGRLTGADMRMLVDHILGVEEYPQIGKMTLIASDLDATAGEVGSQYTFADYDGSFDYSAYVVGDLDYSAGPYLQGVAASSSDYSSIDIAYDGDVTLLTPREAIVVDALHLWIEGQELLDLDLANTSWEVGTAADVGSAIMLKDHFEWSPDMPLVIKGHIDTDDIHVVAVPSDRRRATDLDVQLSGIVSTDQLSADVGVRLYPNPAHNEITFTQPVLGVVVYDMTGKVVLRQNGIMDRLDVSRLGAGVYSIALGSDESGVAPLQRFLKLD